MLKIWSSSKLFEIVIVSKLIETSDPEDGSYKSLQSRFKSSKMSSTAIFPSLVLT
jgi:hypothetical protein